MPHSLRLFPIFVAMLSIVSWGAQNAPGSRTIYVKNHEEWCKNPTTTLCLYLRDCACDKENKSQKRDNGLYYYCDCWSDYRDEDQPAVQGDPTKLFMPFLATDGTQKILFPGTCQDTNELFLKLYSPNVLKGILAVFEVSHLVEFVSGSRALAVDEYFELLANKKIPIGEIAVPGPNVDVSQLYHFYFHDLFNHLPLWIFSPATYRDHVSSRAQEFIALFNALNREFAKNPQALDLVTLMKFLAAAKFDAQMGSANNHIISGNSSNLHAIRGYLAGSINFGLNYPSLELESEFYILSVLKPSRFLRDWIDSMGQNILRSFKRVSKTNNRDEFDSMKAIKKDITAYEAYLRLEKLQIEQIEELIEQIDESAEKALSCTTSSSSDLQKLFSVESFCKELYSNIRAANSKYDKFLDAVSKQI